MKKIVRVYYTTFVDVEIEASNNREAIAKAEDNAYELADEYSEQIFPNIALDYQTEVIDDGGKDFSGHARDLVEANGGSIRFTIEDNCPGDGWDGILTENGCYMFGNDHFDGEFYDFTDEEFQNWADEIFNACEKARD